MPVKTVRGPLWKVAHPVKHLKAEARSDRERGLVGGLGVLQLDLSRATLALPRRTNPAAASPAIFGRGARACPTPSDPGRTPAPAVRHSP
jgi:hypothetical protein